MNTLLLIFVILLVIGCIRNFASHTDNVEDFVTKVFYLDLLMKLFKKPKK